MYDARMDLDRVPELLDRVEREDDLDSWTQLGYRLVLQDTLVFPASFAALPRLVQLAARSAPARELAGAIVRCAAVNHGCDDLLVRCTATIAEFGRLLDLYLQSRPADYLQALRDLLATRGQYHWSVAFEDFTDEFYWLACPHCAVEVTIAIGEYGRYSAIRDWHSGDVDLRDLKPTPPGALSGISRWMYETAVRDGHQELAQGLIYLFGMAECPRCASVFSIAGEYTSANRPTMPQATAG